MSVPQPLMLEEVCQLVYMLRRTSSADFAFDESSLSDLTSHEPEDAIMLITVSAVVAICMIRNESGVPGR